VEQFGVAIGVLHASQKAPSRVLFYLESFACSRLILSINFLRMKVALRNAPTKLMKTLGHGEGYRYAHDEPGGVAAGERYFPDGMAPQAFYQPVPRGLEIKIGERVRQLRVALGDGRAGESASDESPGA
jgi:putative ATPase